MCTKPSISLAKLSVTILNLPALAEQRRYQMQQAAQIQQPGSSIWHKSAGPVKLKMSDTTKMLHTAMSIIQKYKKQITEFDNHHYQRDL